MPFDDETFDFIISTAAFKNFADPIGALREMYRVLRTHRKAVIIDMRRDLSNKALRDFVKSISSNRMGSLMASLTFKSLRRTAYTENQFEDFISKTSFAKHDIRDSEDSIGFEIWLEK